MSAPVRVPTEADAEILKAWAYRMRLAAEQMAEAGRLLATALEPAARAIAEISRRLEPIAALERRPRGPRRLLGERQVRAALARHRRRS